MIQVQVTGLRRFHIVQPDLGFDGPRVSGLYPITEHTPTVTRHMTAYAHQIVTQRNSSKACHEA